MTGLPFAMEGVRVAFLDDTLVILVIELGKVFQRLARLLAVMPEHFLEKYVRKLIVNKRACGRPMSSLKGAKKLARYTWFCHVD